MRWIVDGNNVMGAGGDGWWNDPPAAAARLTQRIAEWCRTHDDPVTVVFDGAPQPALIALGGGNLEIDFARRRGRDAADDRIVEILADLVTESDMTGEPTGGDESTERPGHETAADGDGEKTAARVDEPITPSDGESGVGRDDVIVVVTSDRGLRRRLPTRAHTEGAGTFRQRIGAGRPPGERPR